MKRKKKDFEQYMGCVKVGAKGQIVIPKEIREMFSIEPGESLFVMADTRRGIAIQKQSVANKIADAIFSGNHSEPEITDKDELKGFATNIKKVANEADNEKSETD